jgi:outer membrane phospholipase A
MKQYIAGGLVFFASLTASAEGNWIIANQDETIGAGHTVSLEVVKPTSQANWPQVLRLKLSDSQDTVEIDITAKESGTSDPQRRIYTGYLNRGFAGIVRVSLVDQTSNRLVMLAKTEATAPEVVATSLEQQNDAAAVPAMQSSSPTIVLAKPEDEPVLSSNEPIYFIFGSGEDHGSDARFQVSFKYRPFDPKGSMATYLPFLSNVYFAYTQTTLWDIGGDSSPFKDTSYRPSLFYKWMTNTKGLLPEEVRIGIEHESNGQSGVDSRSLNIGYIRPMWSMDFPSGRRLSFLPKIYSYIEKDDNPDIQQYRGYADWQLRYGREDGLIATGLYRQGTKGYASGQVDISYPISDRLFGRTGTFIHLQLFSGYGETLLDYNQDRDTQLRIGLSVAR